MRHRTEWTREADQFVLARWNDKQTATQVQAALAAIGIHVTRNAVIGRVNRLRKAGASIEQRANPTAARVRGRADDKPVKVRPMLLDTDPATTASSEPDVIDMPRYPSNVWRSSWRSPAVTPPKPHKGGPLFLADAWPLTACRWPIFTGPITATTPIFCGAPAAQGGCYCTEHRARMYAPRQVKAASPAPGFSRKRSA